MRAASAYEEMRAKWQEADRQLTEALVENARLKQQLAALTWISVKERLPQKYEHVMLYLTPVPQGPDWYPRTNYTLGWHKRGIWFGAFISIETGLVEKGEIPEGLVTHWKSLPTPPAPESAA